MSILKKKQAIFARRKSRTRAKISGTAERPRLAIFRSHKYLYVQVIDDTKGHTLVSADTRTIKGATPVDKAKELGREIAQKAKSAGVTKVVQFADPAKLAAEMFEADPAANRL